MIEKTVEDYFVKRVKETGGEVRKLAWLGRRHGPDRFAFWPHPNDCYPAPARCAMIELKRPRKEPNDGQERELARLSRSGLWAFAIASKHEVDCFIETIKKLGWATE